MSDIIKQSKNLLYNIDMAEEWKDISGYEGLYQISSFGRVKSSSRKYGKERILKSFVERDGYFTVCLSKDNKRKTKRIHHLVWDTFGNQHRNGRKIVPDHIDENKLNNRFDNLQLLTLRDNLIKSCITKRKYNLPTGVTPHYKKYQATIHFNGKNRALGTYPTIEMASQVYEQEKIKIMRQQNG
jgi:hypothetical protein